jgi:hypothetical protein
MPPKRNNRKNFTTSIDEDILARLNAYCESEALIRAQVIDKAIIYYLDYKLGVVDAPNPDEIPLACDADEYPAPKPLPEKPANPVLDNRGVHVYHGIGETPKVLTPEESKDIEDRFRGRGRNAPGTADENEPITILSPDDVAKSHKNRKQASPVEPDDIEETIKQELANEGLHVVEDDGE